MDDQFFDFLLQGGVTADQLFDLLNGAFSPSERKLSELSESQLRRLVADEIRTVLLSEEVGRMVALSAAIGVKLYWQAIISMVWDATTWPIRTLGAIIAWPISFNVNFFRAAVDWRNASSAVAFNDEMPALLRGLLKDHGVDVRVAPGVRPGVRFGRWVSEVFHPEPSGDEPDDLEEDDDLAHNDPGLGDAV